MTEMAGLALQEALHARLAGDSELMAGVTGVFDHVPAGTAFPYIVIGDIRQSDYAGISAGMNEHRLVLHVWSRYQGRSEIQDIFARLHGLLHDAGLSGMTDHRLVNLRYRRSDIALSSDGRSYHGSMEFRAVTEALVA